MYFCWSLLPTSQGTSSVQSAYSILLQNAETVSLVAPNEGELDSSYTIISAFVNVPLFRGSISHKGSINTQQIISPALIAGFWLPQPQLKSTLLELPNMHERNWRTLIAWPFSAGAMSFFENLFTSGKIFTWQTNCQIKVSFHIPIFASIHEVSSGWGPQLIYPLSLWFPKDVN